MKTRVLLTTLIVLLPLCLVVADSLPYSPVEKSPELITEASAGYLHDVTPVSFVAPRSLEGGKMQLVQAVVANHGLVADSFAVEFGYLEWDGTFVVKKTKTVDDLPAGEQTNVSFGFYTFPKNIEHDYFVRTVLATDENPDNDVIKQAICTFTTPRSVVLIEKATGTWCGYCPGAAKSVDQLNIDFPGQVAAIDYHVGDTFEHPLCRARTTYYQVPGYPTAKFNGLSEFVGGSSAFTWEDLYQNNYKKRFTAALNHGTCLEMDFTFMKKDGKVNGTVNLTGLAPSFVRDYRIFYVVVESHIAHKWGGLDSLQHVFRGVYPDWNGVPFITDQPIDVGVTFESDIEFDMPTNIVEENCEIIAFVQNIENQAVAVAAIGEQVFPPVIPYSLQVHNTADSDTAGKEIAFEGVVHNLLDSDIIINFNRILNDIPETWTSSICLDLCLAPFVAQASDTVAAHDSLAFSLHFFTSEGKTDSGTVTLQISDAEGLLADSVTFKATGVYYPVETRVDERVPSSTVLKGNYPNPFNPTTTIEYSVADNVQTARLQVYSLLGRLVHEESLAHSRGEHAFLFDAGFLAAGVYMYRIVFEGASGTILSQQQKLTLLK